MKSVNPLMPEWSDVRDPDSNGESWQSMYRMMGVSTEYNGITSDSNGDSQQSLDEWQAEAVSGPKTWKQKQEEIKDRQRKVFKRCIEKGYGNDFALSSARSESVRYRRGQRPPNDKQLERAYKLEDGEVPDELKDSIGNKRDEGSTAA